MTESALAFFIDQFRLFYGPDKEPYEWQKELFELFVSGQIPEIIDLPTGTGKTSLMMIWYFTLLWMKQSGLPFRLPRRLVWVVNYSGPQNSDHGIS